ncbi:DUF3011 domain-containing protein [Montanilutibacter psychrotolerans]|uniref:DUF3011 domain-containing protein n=1 Tax=Montanilutibacter psychrotolerans TaxID=1327343 RepID=A0A3M8SZA0_9GAMM|nr:DUF3011 domain-containing protein [Lysobacter psychrotolerans]RNF84230.1 DUF3011 domain-containing protein [Lysobacter psychrotolerans]
MPQLPSEPFPTATHAMPRRQLRGWLLACLVAVCGIASAQSANQNLRGMTREAQAQAITQAFAQQSGGRSIDANQLGYLLGQVDGQGWDLARITTEIARVVAAGNGQYGDQGYDQGGYGYGSGNQVQCESVDNRYRECRTGFRGRAVMVRKLSDSACNEGQNWGARDGMVWVDRGCRAVFAEQGGWSGGNNRDQVQCESVDNRYRECRTGFRGRAVMVRKLSDSACNEGQNWGARDGMVWVDRGCRAVFAEQGGWSGGNNRDQVQCESVDNRYRECRTGFRRRAVMVRQLSDRACVEGNSWGARDGSVWVNNGCRAIFGEGRGGNGHGQTGRMTCESHDNRRITCPWPPRYGRATVSRRLSNSPCIEGHSWGQSSSTAIWVSNGCRAEFQGNGDGGYDDGDYAGGGYPGGGNGDYQITCSSHSNRGNRCNWDASRFGRPHLIRQLSNEPCIEGRTWGYDGNAVWVSNHCSGRFGAR